MSDGIVGAIAISLFGTSSSGAWQKSIKFKNKIDKYLKKGKQKLLN